MQPVLQTKQVPGEGGQTGWGWAMCSKGVHTGSDLKAQLLWAGQTYWGETLDQHQSQNAAINSGLKRTAKKDTLQNSNTYFLEALVIFVYNWILKSSWWTALYQREIKAEPRFVKTCLIPMSPMVHLELSPWTSGPFQDSKSKKKPKCISKN